MKTPFMSKISFSAGAALLLGFFSSPSLLVFPQDFEETPAHMEVPVPGDTLQVTLGRDSPNLGGNVFREAFLAVTLTNAIGVETGKIISEISFDSEAGIAFERAELTPDMEAAGATLEIESGGEADLPLMGGSGSAVEVEAAQGGEATSTLKITIASGSPLPDGIIANLVFQITKEFSLEEVGTEEHLVTLENKVSAWTPDEQEIVDAYGGPGGIDLAYAPVVFACLFYMH